MNEYDEELYVIVQWGDGAHQLRQHNDSVHRFLTEKDTFKVITDPIPYEEALALFVLFPNRLKHVPVYPPKK